MSTCKFKVGDIVIGNHPDAYGITKKGWIGKVTEIRPNSIKVRGASIGGEMSFWVDPVFFDLYNEEKIVITHDGKITTATKYCADGSKVTATARCAPEDTFDFNVGAELAMERLMEKTKPVVEWRVVNRRARPGDYFRLKRVDYPDIDKLGDILKADGVVNDMIYVLEKNHPHCESKTSEFHWNYCRSEYEVVEKVTPNEPPKYYNGKVICVKNEYFISNPISVFTVGKVYDVVNGVIVSDTGYRSKKYDTVQHLCIGMGHTFIPLVE